MTTEIMHQPTPEFRDYLENEIAREFRSHRSFARLRVAAFLFATLAVGTSAGLASAQIRQGAQRDSLLETANSELQLLGFRVRLAQAILDEAQKAHKVGAFGSEQVAHAEAELRQVQVVAMRAKLNVDEITASAMPPRDDLNAPLVGTRDFVSERLQFDLFGAQQNLSSAERANEEVLRQFRAGVVSERNVLEASLDVTRARSALGVLMEKQKLRQEFVARGTPVEQLNRNYREAQLRFDVMAGLEAVNLLKHRYDALKKQQASGAASELDVLRAQVEMLEREAEVQLLARQLREIRKPDLPR